MNQTPTPDGIAGLVGLMMLLPMLTCGFMVVSLGFWIWMLVDCVTNKALVGNDRLVWILVVIFTNWIGGLIYFFVARPKRFQPVPSSPRSPPPRPPLLPVMPPPLTRVEASATADSPTELITCPNCGKTAPFDHFKVDAANKGTCPHCSVHVEFE